MAGFAPRRRPATWTLQVLSDAGYVDVESFEWASKAFHALDECGDVTKRLLHNGRPIASAEPTLFDSQEGPAA